MSSETPRVLYTGVTQVTGGREGAAYSSDGRLDVLMTSPGVEGPGTNPEQLLGAGWSACFLSAVGLAAQERKVSLPQDAAVEAEIDLRLSEAAGYHLAARLTVSLPGLDRITAQALLERAHETCPYSKALRGNIAVETTLA
jgi:Ohr subfamily peroxiredoxin